MRFTLAVMLMASTALTAARAGAECPARTDYPGADWPTEAISKNDVLARIDELAFTLTGKDEERKGTRTDGVVVVHRGRVVFEKYARGHGPTNRHQVWSISKNVTSLLTGVATLHAGFDIDRSICEQLDPADRTLCDITTRHLLEWTSGLDFNEFYEDESNQRSSVLAMLYGEGRKDMAAFMLTHRLVAQPGTRWSYSTGDNTLAARVIQNAMQKAGFNDDWPHELLFDRIGAPRITFERDNVGTLVGGSTVLATPRDLARIGFLAMNDGCWNGERLLPEGWMSASLTPTPAYRSELPEPVNMLDSPALSWWLNRPVPEHEQPKPLPSAPDDLFWGRGHWGQFLYVMPSQDLVVVRFGDDREPGVFPHDAFLAAVLDLVKE